MKTVFKIAVLQQEDILVKGNYGSDGEPYDENRTVLRILDEFDDERTAIEELPKYSWYGEELTIIKVYKF